MGAVLAAAVAGLPQQAAGCGPYFQPSYLASQEPYSIHYNRHSAMLRLAESMKHLLKEQDIFPEGISTKNAVYEDFSEAVASKLPHLSAAERQSLIGSYMTYKIRGWKSKDGKTPTIEELPELPEPLLEFTLYEKGVKEMREDGKEIPPSWQKLLALPPGMRYYRTVWVHFMLGNYLNNDCHKHYRNCRDAVRKGFSDTAGLARRSFANEYLYGTDPVLCMHAAVSRQRHEKKESVIYGLYISKITPEVMEDELCREFLAAFSCSDPYFLRAMKKYKFRNSDIMAYDAWVQGDWAAAQEFISLMRKPSLLSLYLEAKLARMAGNNVLMIEKLRAWLQMVKDINWDDRKDILMRKDGEDPFEYYEGESLELDVYGLLGNALVLRRDFIEAAECFFRGGQLESDFAEVTESFMTLDELIKLNSRLAADKSLKKADLDMLRHLIARRAFRENRMDIAQKYMPEKYCKNLDDYLNFIRQSQDKRLDRNSRALALYNAFKIMRFAGMELCGTENDPDNFRYDGSYGMSKSSYCQKCAFNIKTTRFTLCAQHRGKGNNRGRISWNRVPRHLRFHYRYRAGELALQAAQLAADKDLKALIYRAAGHTFQRYQPKIADVFYKQLVRECSGTKLAAAADKARWFPVVPGLIKELNSIAPVKSLNEVHTLMQQAFKEK